MSQQNPEEIRAEIEATRARLGADVDAVSEKVTPDRVVDRQKSKVRGKVQDVREHVMGSSDDHSGGSDLRGEAAHRAEQARDAAQNVPSAAKSKARGNPFAAGLIALGAGWLIGSALPSSQKEQDLAAKAADRAQPHAQGAAESAKDNAKSMAKDAVKNVAMNVVTDVKEPAKDAAQSVKETAQSGAQEVKEEGKSQGQHLKSSAQGSAQNVKGQSKNS